MSLDERRMDAWKALLSTQRALLDRLGEELRHEHGLPLSWYDVLVQLSSSPGRRLRMNELAASVLLTPSGLTRLVDRLESEGLVRRESCPTDRRGAEVVLTDEGRARLRAASPTHLWGIERHFARHLSDDEAETLLAALRRIHRALRDEGDHDLTTSPGDALGSVPHAPRPDPENVDREDSTCYGSAEAHDPLDHLR